MINDDMKKGEKMEIVVKDEILNSKVW